ncbi:MAG: hypothetical protein ACKV2V_25185 [Blastocatellia bacterium]
MQARHYPISKNLMGRIRNPFAVNIDILGISVNQIVGQTVSPLFVISVLKMDKVEPEATRGKGSQKIWQPVRPAMAAGLTDHVWTTSELLSYRTPAGFLKTLHDMADPLHDSDDIYQGNCGTVPGLARRA